MGGMRALVYPRWIGRIREISFSECAVNRSFLFFFSSRRRHTRFKCDWSSDVCSSDLAGTDLPKEVKAIIPRKAAQEMRRLLEEEEGEPLLGFTKNLVTFQKSGLYLTSRVMEGTYPNYQQVIPKESAKKAVIERAGMEGALPRVAVLSKDKTNAVKLMLQPGSLTLPTINPDLGEATRTEPAHYRRHSLTTP